MDWELPCYITSFHTVVMLGVGLNAKPDLTLETWAHHKALERLQQQELAAASASALRLSSSKEVCMAAANTAK